MISIESHIAEPESVNLLTRGKHLRAALYRAVGSAIDEWRKTRNETSGLTSTTGVDFKVFGRSGQWPARFAVYVGGSYRSFARKQFRVTEDNHIDEQAIFTWLDEQVKAFYDDRSRRRREAEERQNLAVRNNLLANAMAEVVKHRSDVRVHSANADAMTVTAQLTMSTADFIKLFQQKS